MKHQTTIVGKSLFILTLFFFLWSMAVLPSSAKEKVKVSAPTTVRARSSQEQYIRVKWKKVSKADGYQIYQYKAKEKSLSKWLP